MGLVKTRRLAAMQKQQRAKAGAEVLPTTFAEATAVRMWECCQFHCCQFSIED